MRMVKKFTLLAITLICIAIVSGCQNDTRKCAKLINHLIDINVFTENKDMTKDKIIGLCAETPLPDEEYKCIMNAQNKTDYAYCDKLNVKRCKEIIKRLKIIGFLSEDDVMKESGIEYACTQNPLSDEEYACLMQFSTEQDIQNCMRKQTNN